MALPPFIVHVSAVAEVEANYPAPFDAEKLSCGRDLGTAAGTRTLGVWHERLQPGRRTSFTHAHSAEEELVYVLTGTCHARIVQADGSVEEHALEPGHLVAFPAGTRIAHCIVNRGTSDATLLCVGERRPEDRVTYPEDQAFEDHVRAKRPGRVWSAPGSERNE